MKKYILISGLLVLLAACEKKTASSAVPEQVKDSFNLHYPQAQEVQWKVQHDKYAAVFTYQGEKREAEFNANGASLGTEE